MLKMKLRFQDELPTLDPIKLGEFVFHFKILIGALSDINNLPRTNETREPSESDKFDIIKKLKHIDINKIELFSRQSDEPNELKIQSINYNSPLEIEYVYWGSILVIAVVLGGGSIELSDALRGLTIKATLPSLGESIVKIRQALSFGKNIQTGFGIKTTTIKLNKEEFKLLMIQDDNTRTRGGFQNFLVGLKYRINRNTKELDLNDSDIEKIRRYKQDPKKGGFQSRCKKIFERNFPEN